VTLSRALLLAVSMTTTPLMGVTFLALQNGFLDFFPCKPIGGVQVSRPAGVGRAHQGRGNKEPASGLVRIRPAAFGEHRYERSDGKHHMEKPVLERPGQVG
jgi:hypothetical protein